MIWILTLACNSIIMAMLWLLSEVAVTPAYNLLVQYAETKMALPVLTDWAFQIRPYGRLLPIGWAVVTILYGLRLRRRHVGERSAGLAFHLSATLCLGLAQLVFFAIAGILPVLKIGALVN